MTKNRTPDAVDVHIGMRIRTIRLQRGVSQENLGDKLGLSFQQVQKYEKGANRVGGSRMQQIATILGVTPAYFYEGLPKPGSKGTPDSSIAFLATSSGMRIAKAFPHIADEAVQQKLVHLIETIAGRAAA